MPRPVVSLRLFQLKDEVWMDDQPVPLVHVTELVDQRQHSELP